MNKATYTDSVNQTPYFAGIISGSMLWVVFCWVTRLVRRMSANFFFHSSLNSYKKKYISTETQSHAISHLMFALTVGLCAYNFFRAITLDPGICPKPTSDDELKSVILSSFLWNQVTEIRLRLLRILHPKEDSTVKRSASNAWPANPSGLNTAVYVTNALQGAISKFLSV